MIPLDRAERELTSSVRRLPGVRRGHPPIPRVGTARRAVGELSVPELSICAFSALIPIFIPTTRRMTPHPDGHFRNIVPGQGTYTDVGERQFGIYTLFEGTSEIQRLVISRAISGLHIR